MSRSARLALSSVGSFFALCVTAAACGPGGGSRSTPYIQPRYTSPYQSSYATATAPVSPQLNQQLQKPVPPAAPKAHISVVSTESTLGTSTAPVGRIQLANATSEPKAKIVQVVKTEPKTAEVAKIPAAEGADPAKMLEGLMPSKDEPAKIADSLKGLVGPWMAVSRQGDGELSTVELLLNDNGWAKLTVPGADGKPSTSTRKIEFENNELKLTGGDADVLLGKLVEFDSRQMVLERQGGQVTFVRP